MKQLIIILFSLFSLSGVAQVTLNEMQSSNNSTIADEAGEFDDWIEIHNPGSDSIEISGLILKDQIDTWAIPTGDPSTLIPPGGYFFLWADDQEIQGIFHTNFKLASGGEFLGLYESDGITVIDSLTIPALNANDSYYRCNDGWAQTNMPTPLADNNCTTSYTENLKFDDVFSIVLLSNKQLELKVLDDLNDEKSVAIYSLDGKEMLRESLKGKEGILDLAALNSGTYIVTISSADRNYSKKIAL